MKVISTLTCVFFMLVSVSVSFANSENRGRAKLDINGGNKGDVPFPHNLHQLYAIDCDICHNVFPKRAGAIMALIEKDKLAKKQVMNKLCIPCHKKNKQTGNKTGPTTCKSCHLKKQKTY